MSGRRLGHDSSAHTIILGSAKNELGGSIMTGDEMAECFNGAESSLMPRLPQQAGGMQRGAARPPCRGSAAREPRWCCHTAHILRVFLRSGQYAAMALPAVHPQVHSSSTSMHFMFSGNTKTVTLTRLPPIFAGHAIPIGVHSASQFASTPLSSNECKWYKGTQK